MFDSMLHSMGSIKMSNYVLALFVFACFAFNSTRIPYTSKSSKAIQLYEQALSHYAKKEYQKTKELFKQAIKKDKKFVEAYLQLAIIQQRLDNFEAAIKLLDQAKYYLFHGDHYQLYYELAYLYYRSGAYQKSQDVLKALPPKSAISATLLAKVVRLQKDVDFSLEKIKIPVAFEARPLSAPLNQFASQYFPVLTVDQQTMFFTARSSETQGKENIYVSYKDEADNWTIPQPLTGSVNSEHNQGTCTISADGKVLVFTACSCKGNCGICDLYVTYKEDNQWSTPKNLGPNINSKGWESQPSLSADGKTLYFVSEREGNYGKKDIWKSTLQEDGEWSEPVNLGPPVNSEARELSPFIHPNGQTLFFASDRCPSLGGFNIYYTNWIDGKWTEPVNLGYPINNHRDQAALFVTADGKKGYYADGNQKGTSYYSSHLYEFDFPEDLLQFPKSDFIKLKVVDTQRGTPVTVEVYDMETNTQQWNIQIDLKDGAFVVVVNEGKEYVIFVRKDKYLFESIHVDYKNHSKPVVSAHDKVLLEPIKVDKTKVLKNVFFDFDDYRLAPRSITELNCLVKFLQANPQLLIEIEGHTDQTGTEEYNYCLSTKRAQAIYDYLVATGIDADRLTYKGYSQSRPLAPQQNSPASARLNRRAAFRITGIK